MKVEQLTAVDKHKARELWRAYRKHQHYSAPYDEEITRIYKQIAMGRTVIRALESIKQAGIHTEGANMGLPRLAIARADKQACQARLSIDGGAEFGALNNRWDRTQARGLLFSFPAKTFPPRTEYIHIRAAVPIIPAYQRPKRSLANYHVLWEAEWTRVPPRDPYLLRRLGGDAWLVVAAWELTEVERAVMATRLAS